jgi:hypothetical protein
MTSDGDSRTRIVLSWLREDAHENAERALLRALDEVDTTPQRRPWWPAWRFSDMNNVAKGLVAMAAVVAVAFVGINLLPGTGSGPGSLPSPSPTAVPTKAPTASPSPASTAAGLPQGAFALEDGGVALTVTIPSSGWTYDSEYSSLTKGTEVANLPEAAILFWTFPAETRFYVYGDPCRSESTKPDAPVATVDEITAGLAAQASRNASGPADVTVGGHEGKAITLHVPDDAAIGECEAGEFVSYGTTEDPLTRYHEGPGQIDDLWLLEVEGSYVIIDAMYRADTPPALVEEMRAIAESTTFGAP